MGCEWCKRWKQGRKVGRYSFQCVGCCARLVLSARPDKRLAAGHLAALSLFEGAPSRAHVLRRAGRLAAVNLAQRNTGSPSGTATNP